MIAPGAAPGSFAITPGAELRLAAGPALEVQVIPDVQVGQRALLQMLPQTSPPAGGVMFDGGAQTHATDTLSFPIAGLAHGTYFVRVLVDGADEPPSDSAPAARQMAHPSPSDLHEQGGRS